jgi:SulP family sulfate permease
MTPAFAEAHAGLRLPVAVPLPRQHLGFEPPRRADADAGQGTRVGRFTDRLWQLPILAGLSGYRPAFLRADVAAGLAIASVAIPSAVAYPAIAGLPPATGLYASIFPLVGYALFGPSRRLIVGPDAGTVTVLGAVFSGIVASHPELAGADRVPAAAIMSLGVGLICLGAFALRLGALASLLSRPILIGFFAGMALSIAIGQIGRLTGVKIQAEGLVSPWIELAGKFGGVHPPSLALALAMLALMQGAKALRSPVPGPVLVVVVAVAASWLLDLPSHGVAVVGSVPSAFPRLAWPSWGGWPLEELAKGAAAAFVIAFGAGVITARSFAAMAGTSVDPNRELVGFGAANVMSGLFGAFPVTASDSRTAVNVAVGGRSQVAGLVAAAALMGVVTFLGPLLALVPLPALGAILVSAALGLIDLPALRTIWRVSRVEFVFALVALLGAVSFGVVQGVVVSIMGTLAYALYKGMYPRVVMFGRIPGRDGVYKLHHFAEARPVPGLAICLVQGDLLFFSVDSVKARLDEITAELPPDTAWFLLDASAMSRADTTSAAMLEEFRQDLAKRGVALAIAELHSDARDVLQRAGLVDAVTPRMIFDDVEDGLAAFLAAYPDRSDPAQPRVAERSGA